MASNGIRRRNADKDNSICTSIDVDGNWSLQFLILLYFSTVFFIWLSFSVFIHLSIYTCPLHRFFGDSLVHFNFSILLGTVSSSGRWLTWLLICKRLFIFYIT